MARRAKKVCRKLGCNALVEIPGHCDDHQKETTSFATLDSRKTVLTKKFYSSWKWTKTSRRFRTDNPLCEECKEKGIVQSAEMVHHEPPLEVLLEKGMNAYDSQYLHSLCDNCHLGHLREKKNH